MSLRSCRRSQARRFRPCAADGGAHVASTYGDDPSRRQPPSRFRPGFALVASHSRPNDMRRCRLIRPARSYSQGAVTHPARAVLRARNERCSNSTDFPRIECDVSRSVPWRAVSARSKKPNKHADFSDLKDCGRLLGESRPPRTRSGDGEGWGRDRERVSLFC